MNKRERVSSISKVHRLIDKYFKMNDIANDSKKEAQKILDRLAKKACPYKRGQIFSKAGSSVRVRVNTVGSHSLSCSRRPPENFWKGPFVLDCKRCDAKGKLLKSNTNWFFIDGFDIGEKWILED